MEFEGDITERRRQTRGNLYRHLYHSKNFCTKQTLSRELMLSLPTVYQGLSELMDSGLVRYSGVQRSTGGRKAQGLEIVPDARYAIGMSLTENRLRFVLADLNMREVFYRKIYHLPVCEMNDLGQFLAVELDKFIVENSIDCSRLLGVGISLPGVVSAETGLITAAPTLSLHNITLEKLTAKIPYPCYVENDATSDGFAEWFGQPDRRDLAYLLLETGVGGAVMLQGNQYLGGNRRSGEFGHMCVEPNGLPCHCGRNGCLEAYCSARRISTDLGITVEEFFKGIEAHRPDYEALWDDVLHHLAIGIHNIRMALDCDVVLGGFMAQYLEPYLDLLKSYVVALNPFDSDANFLRLSALSRHSVPMGVALHYIKEFVETV
jgi:predicted NBD/HSP70 family sugar kinase